MTAALTIVAETDAGRIASFLRQRRGSAPLYAEGKVYAPDAVEAVRGRDKQELTKVFATFIVEGDTCRLLSLDSLDTREGAGTALVAHLLFEARKRGCARLRAVIGNDATEALRFLQKRGGRIVALTPGSLDEARQRHPDIPLTGRDGLPMRDEIALEWSL
ncbi:MAG: hypothetical protein C0606_17295 [Hyphomicrobiales bacterium]|nr:MAG: hypothetical protein C0606_17295 [Hyphomicrobiales bacterium]